MSFAFIFVYSFFVPFVFFVVKSFFAPSRLCVRPLKKVRIL